MIQHWEGSKELIHEKEEANTRCVTEQGMTSSVTGCMSLQNSK
jgi:hypothetical protein